MVRTRSSILTLLLLAAIPLAQAAQTRIATAPKSATALDPANTCAVIVGALKWEDRGLTPYPVKDRKDQELCDTLRRRGVPVENMALLLDEKATLANMRKSLQKMAERGKPGSTLIFYYCGHGWRSPEGRTSFANYDYHGKKPDKPAFVVSEITEIVRQHFKGDRVLLFADCCFSGGLQDVVQSLGRAKFQAAAITSADALCVSCGNWTFTQTLVDALAGEPYLDANGDGSIALGELASEVALAMQFREQQRYGQALAELTLDFRLGPADRTKKLSGPIDGAFALKEFVAAREGDRQRVGRIVGFKEGKYAVEFFTYSDKEVVSLPASALSKIRYRTYKVGDTVTVARAGLPRAKVVEVAGDFHRIAFPAQPMRGQEWVLSDRIVEDPASVAEVLWEGKWYPATILKTEKDRYRIHYLGFDDNWNEWVGKERIRVPGKARNPFDVEDVPDPDGQDVKAAVARMKLPGGDKDKNAEQWVKEASAGKPGTLDGDWSGRWDGASGTAKIRVIKDRVYVLYTDTDGQLKGTTWLLEAVQEGKGRLVGRWMQVGNSGDTGPYLGLIVDGERIDGTWGDSRWDFRRKLKK